MGEEGGELELVEELVVCIGFHEVKNVKPDDFFGCLGEIGLGSGSFGVFTLKKDFIVGCFPWCIFSSRTFL